MTVKSLFCIVAAALVSALPRPEQSGPPAPQTVYIQQLDRAKFDTLPPDAVIVLQGDRRVTKRELVEDARRSLDRQREAARRAAQGAKEFQSRRDRFLLRERQRLATANAQARAELAKLATGGAIRRTLARRAAIEREAMNLYARYQKASPSERAAIDRRANELMSELSHLDPKVRSIRRPPRVD